MAEIDAELAAGATAPATGARYGLKGEAVRLHRRSHLVKELQRGFDLRAISRAKELAQRVELLLMESVDILESAREQRKDVACPACKLDFSIVVAPIRDRVAAAKQVGDTLELVGRLTGAISSAPVVQLFATLQVRDQAELEARVRLARGLDNVTLEDAFADALEVLQLVRRERPELWASAQAALPPALEAHNGNGNGHAPAA